MKKNYTKQLLLLFALITFSFSYGQTNRVLVTVEWLDESYKNKVEVYDPANNLLVAICNGEECYQSSGSSETYSATYDLGCLAITPILPDYYIKIFNTDDNDWSGSASVVVNVAGVDVLTNDGTGASTAGNTIAFSVNSATVCTFPDTDGDGVIDFVDQDDDNDGILDIEEGLALNSFNCAVPSLVFEGGTLDSGTAGTVGAIYRFDNALEGYDVLLKITELTNTTIVNIDDDTDTPGSSTPSFLQSQFEFSGNGTPGATYEFTIVDDNTSTPASSIFRIGGTTWDCDGTDDYQESVRYYNPSAYGLDNPTSLTQDDYGDGAGITAGTVTYGGFSTNTILRSYFQFLSNTFTIRMQLKKTTTSSVQRLYAMSFTQCDIFDYKAPTLTILAGQDTDGDGFDNQMDIDADNDGIPDNVEGQATIGYQSPTMTLDASGNPVTGPDGLVIGVDPVTGIDNSYTLGFTIVDTDGDNIPDFIDSDSDGDGTPDIDENGMDSAGFGTDSDGDGLDDVFESGTDPSGDPTTELDPLDVNDEIDDPTDLSVLPDFDSDLGNLGGDLDYRDASDFGAANIDFDGVDDYVEVPTSVLNTLDEYTISFWIKPNELPTGDIFDKTFVIGQKDMFEVGIGNGNDGLPYIWSRHFYGTGPSSQSVGHSIDATNWLHYTAIINYNIGYINVYINGEQKTGLGISSNPRLTNSNSLRMGSSRTTQPDPDQENFKGWLDEVRIFDTLLTTDQIQRMVYQEIEESVGNNVKGTIINKEVVDISVASSEIPWSNLVSYYPMTNIQGNKLFDESSFNNVATLYNITTLLEQTAPMPYETVANGPWTAEGTWLYGNVWDIEDIPNNKDWSIVHLHDNVATTDSHTQLGMFIDEGVTLTVGDIVLDNQDFEINNSWYLQLDGTINLQDDSQLVQGEFSNLVTTDTDGDGNDDGKILRRQEGNQNYYWYNYWSSPIGAMATTNNTNTDFSINMLKNGSGNSFTFTNSFEAPGQISNRWLYTFKNGITYWNWVALNEFSQIEPGVGYTQKGTNSTNGDQHYIFEGKPNNGTILLSGNDVDNDDTGVGESVQDVSFTSYLVGNPYPSAINAKTFIDDNNGVINGAVYVWEQWAGTSHILEQYEGGYGTINNASTERAYQWNDPSQTTLPFAKKPTFYIPVAQGFFVEVVEDDDIEFNNNQRVFVLESNADGTNPENGSVFFRNNEENSSNQTNDEAMGIIRLELNVSNGNNRSFVLAFSDSTTDEFDYGYDARTIDPQDDDLNSFLGDEKMIIQSFAQITDDKVIDLMFNSTGTYNYTVEMVEINNIPENQEVYLRDNLSNTYFDLRTGAYNFSSDISGADAERFDIVFQSADTLSNEDFTNDNTIVFVNNTEDKLYVKGLTAQVRQLNMTNMLGQIIKTFNNINNQSLENGLNISNLSSGVYLVNVITENNLTIDKKIVID